MNVWSTKISLEKIMARICREVGGRLHTNLVVRDRDVPANTLDGRRLEVVVDGLSVRGRGVQVAIDTTTARASHCDGTPRR